MDHEEFESGFGCIFIICLAFIVLGVFGLFGGEVKSVLLVFMSFLSIVMICVCLWKTLK